MTTRRLILGLVALLATYLLLAVPATAQDGQEGQEAYNATCSGCHGRDGNGLPGSFPPLVDNSRALDEGYVSSIIRNGLSGPLEVNGITYDAQMPAFSQLSEAEVAAIAAFVATNFEAVEADPTPTSVLPQTFVPPPGADADRGEDLFVGSTRFVNGGAACAACHTAGGRGNLGGSSMGPDLTNVLASYGGPDGLISVLDAPAFPVMREAYADKPFTDQEKLDLSAFFVRASEETDSDSGDAMLVIGLVGAVALFGGMVVIRPFTGAGYSRRLRRNS